MASGKDGRQLTRRPDGEYRSSQGEVLPDLPDEPNCRCMTVPVLKPPREIAPEFWQHSFKQWEDARRGREPLGASAPGQEKPAGAEAPQKSGLDALGKSVPAADDMAQWWKGATEKQREQAVGKRRYQQMKKLLGREPRWEHFIDPQGHLMSVEDLAAESRQERNRRLGLVRKQLTAQRRAFRDVSRLGVLWPYRRLPTHKDLNLLWQDVFPLWRKVRDGELPAEALGDQTRWAKFGVVDKKQAQRIRNELRRQLQQARAKGNRLRERLLSRLVNLDLENFEHVLQAEDLAHMLNEHGPGREKREGQVPLQKRHVVQMLPRLVQQFDSVSMGDVGTEQAPKEWVKRNKLRIEFHKKGKKYVTHYVAEISQKDQKLSGVTMYVTRR